jgi:hypothetical protein
MADDERPEDDFDDGDTGSTGRRPRPDPDRDIKDIGDVGENPSFFDDPDAEPGTRAEPEDFGFDDISRDDEPARRGRRSRGGGATRPETRFARPARGRGVRLPSRPRSGGGGRGASIGGINLQSPIARIALAVGFIIILGIVLALVVQDCRRSALVDSYKRYTNNAVQISDDSKDQGKQLLALLANKENKKAGDLQASVKALAVKADDLAKRADGLSPPGPMRDADAALLTALRYRATNLALLADDIPGIFQGTNKETGALTVATRMKRFAASDVIYQDGFVGPARAALTADNVSGIEVPETAVFLPGTTENYSTQAGAATIVTTLKGGSTSNGGTTTGGRRGNSLVGVTASPDGTALSTTATTDLTTDLTDWLVTVEDSGDFDEENVKVTATFTYADNSRPPLTTEATIPLIAKGKTVEVKLKAPTGDQVSFGKVGTLNVKVAPVDLERNTGNNAADYQVKIVFN